MTELATCSPVVETSDTLANELPTLFHNVTKKDDTDSTLTAKRHCESLFFPLGKEFAALLH